MKTVLKVEEFENLPSAVGRYSTKFWLRDFKGFIEQSDEDDSEFDQDGNSTTEEIL